MRAGVYLRISLDRTGERLAVGRQREDCEQLIALRGWTVAETFTDNDTSAAGRAKRPAFDALLKAVDSNRVGVVVSWSLDRLTRNRRDQLRLIEACQRQSVNLALVRGADVDLSSAVGRAVADILSATARLEIEQKSERQIRAIQQQAERGRMVGGRRAFGYTADGLQLEPAESVLLRSMYEQFLSGAPMGAIATWLNNTGVRTPRGGRWRTETVRVVLANPRNAGWRALRPIDPATGRREFYHAEPVAPGKWPAVVTDAVWRATVITLQDPTRRTSPGNQPRYLLSGVARCGWPDCGLPMFTSTSHGVRVLRCQSRRHVNRRADVIEALVERTVIGHFAGPGRGLVPSGDSGPDVEAARAEAAALRTRLKGLAGLFASGDLDETEVRASSRDLRERIAVQDGVVADASRSDPADPLRSAEDPATVWDEMDLVLQREVLRAACEITILPGRPGQPRGIRFHDDSVAIRFL